MERVGKLVLLVVAVGLITQTARPHYLYGAWLDDGTANIEFAGLMIPVGMGAIMVLLHCGKTALLAVAAGLWRRGQHMYSALAVVLFLLLLPVSITSTFGFLDLQRGARAAGENSTHRREADLRSELAGVQTWLKNGGWRRSVALVEADLAAERRSAFWASSGECRNATTRPEQRFCQALDRSVGELAGAREAEKYRVREKELYAALKNLQPTTASPHPDLEFLSRALAVSLDKARFWRTILFAAAIGTAEALLLLLGSVPTSIDRRKRVRPRWAALRSLLNGRGVRGSVLLKQRLPAIDGRCSTRVATGTSETKAADTPATRTAPACADQRAVSTSATSNSVELSPRPRVAVSMAEQAVVAFVGNLPRAPEARASGTAMFQAYEARREVWGWPRLSPSQFGRLLKPAIGAAGGRKLKSNRQVYTGFAVRTV